MSNDASRNLPLVFPVLALLACTAGCVAQSIPLLSGITTESTPTSRQVGANAQEDQKEMAGREIGAVAGAIVGSVVTAKTGNRQAKDIGMLAGILAGSFAGKVIGRKLDDSDREKMAMAAQEALDSGKAVSWSNSTTSSSGKVEVTGTGNQDKGGKQCRTVRQTVKTKDGSVGSEDVRMCRTSAGWEKA